MSKATIDSIIFDMDGTLWDAVDSYAIIWNTTLDQAGIAHDPVTRQDLMKLMGSYLDDILNRLVPHPQRRAELMKRLVDNETTMMRTLGGRLYPHVKDIIMQLAQRYKLFMVSNCGPHGLDNFVAYTGLSQYFTDLLTHGGTGVSKAENIATLMRKYDLRSPVYVGDTQGDADNARKAGIPVIWAAYGFGHIDRPDATIHAFDQLPQAVEHLTGCNSND